MTIKITQHHHAYGVLYIYFTGICYNPKSTEKNIPIWAAYDNVTATGDEFKNGDCESINQKKG
ncbi:MAG: hypothetical protein JKX85_02860 [Phycisphaeraceae bacterium]|nr:hypothetical protein [Phycisphaeraceae bacterium]